MRTTYNEGYVRKNQTVRTYVRGYDYENKNFFIKLGDGHSKNNKR
jgi:hypothetical protein